MPNEAKPGFTLDFMAIHRATEDLELVIGEKRVIEAPAPDSAFVVAFEDDGETGYFYACEKGAPTYIQDAVHIYNVAQSKHMAPMGLDVFWSSDGQVGALFIERIAHAVFDFGQKRGWCRSAFPPPAPGWNGHTWDDSCLQLLV